MTSESLGRPGSIADLAPGLDVLVAETMGEWKIPGLALAVTASGEPPLLKAYGHRDIEAGLPVTADTHFMICSITKTFAAVSLALLVDERRLDWAKPVRDYLPEFRLQDTVATERVTVRDVLCHHSGLPRHDWIWMPGDFTQAQMLACLADLEPREDVRSMFLYNNLGYLVAGMVSERLSGLPWEEFIRTRLTDKLQMNVGFNLQDLVRETDAAVPYGMDADTRFRAAALPISTTPAGGIHTSISGLSKWMQFLLDRGRLGEQQLLSTALLAEMQKPRVHVATSEFPETGDVHYGLGFECHQYRGERMLGHGGGWIGWGTLMTLLPDRGVGVAVFTNREPSPVANILTSYVVDRLCEKPPIDWLGRFRQRRAQFLAQLETDRETRKAVRRKGTKPSHDLAEYAGDYQHPAYGTMRIAVVDDGLRWDYRGMSARLMHRHYDTFELPEVPDRLLPDRLAISFATDRDGNIASAAAAFEPTVADIVFVRQASGKCTELTFRRLCVGAFRHAAATHVVALDAEGQLTLTPPAQMTYRLHPYQDTTFEIVELTGYRVEFRCDENGVVDQMIFHQPNGTFLAHRAMS